MTQQVGISPSRRDGITINSIVAPTVESGGLFSMDPSGILRGAKPNFKSVMSRRFRKCVKNRIFRPVLRAAGIYEQAVVKRCWDRKGGIHPSTVEFGVVPPRWRSCVPLVGLSATAAGAALLSESSR